MEYDDEFMIVFARFGMLSAGVICCDLRCGLRFAGGLLVANSPTARRPQEIMPVESPSTCFTSRSVSWMSYCGLALVSQAEISYDSNFLRGLEGEIQMMLGEVIAQGCYTVQIRV